MICCPYLTFPDRLLLLTLGCHVEIKAAQCQSVPVIPLLNHTKLYLKDSGRPIGLIKTWKEAVNCSCLIWNWTPSLFLLVLSHTLLDCLFVRISLPSSKLGPSPSLPPLFLSLPLSPAHQLIPARCQEATGEKAEEDIFFSRSVAAFPAAPSSLTITVSIRLWSLTPTNGEEHNGIKPGIDSHPLPPPPPPFNTDPVSVLNPKRMGREADVQGGQEHRLTREISRSDSVRED